MKTLPGLHSHESFDRLQTWNHPMLSKQRQGQVRMAVLDGPLDFPQVELGRLRSLME